MRVSSGLYFETMIHNDYHRSVLVAWVVGTGALKAARASTQDSSYEPQIVPPCHVYLFPLATTAKVIVFENEDADRHENAPCGFYRLIRFRNYPQSL